MPSPAGDDLRRSIGGRDGPRRLIPRNGDGNGHSRSLASRIPLLTGRQALTPCRRRMPRLAPLVSATVCACVGSRDGVGARRPTLLAIGRRLGSGSRRCGCSFGTSARRGLRRTWTRRRPTSRTRPLQAGHDRSAARLQMAALSLACDAAKGPAMTPSVSMTPRAALSSRTRVRPSSPGAAPRGIGCSLPS